MRLKSMLARVRVNGECSASLWYLTSEKRLLSAIKGRVVLFFFQKEIWQLFRNENFCFLPYIKYVASVGLHQSRAPDFFSSDIFSNK